MGIAAEIIGSVWLVIVAVRFLGGYLGTSSADLTYTYWAMLAAIAVVQAVKWLRR